MATVNREGITSCCNAYSTYMDDGDGGWVECCKKCFNEVHHENA